MKDLTQEQVDKICRDNAIRMLHLDLPDPPSNGVSWATDH